MGVFWSALTYSFWGTPFIVVDEDGVHEGHDDNDPVDDGGLDDNDDNDPVDDDPFDFEAEFQRPTLANLEGTMEMVRKLQEVLPVFTKDMGKESRTLDYKLAEFIDVENHVQAEMFKAALEWVFQNHYSMKISVSIIKSKSKTRTKVDYIRVSCSQKSKKCPFSVRFGVNHISIVPHHIEERLPTRIELECSPRAFHLALYLKPLLQSALQQLLNNNPGQDMKQLLKSMKASCAAFDVIHNDRILRRMAVNQLGKPCTDLDAEALIKSFETNGLRHKLHTVLGEFRHLVWVPKHAEAELRLGNIREVVVDATFRVGRTDKLLGIGMSNIVLSSRYFLF
jgi:hypothetical protein